MQWLQNDNANHEVNSQLDELEKYLGKQTVDNYKKNKDTDSLIQSLLDRHGTGRVLYRNTRDSVGGFPQREMHSYALQQPEIYAADTDELEHQLYPEKDF